VTVTPEAASHTETLENYLLLIETAVRGKTNKKYGPNFIFLVAVDDYYALIQDYDWQLVPKRVQPLTQHLDVGRIVFVGYAERLFLSQYLSVVKSK